ncbi:MAG: carotenoid 1,2-hydratase [Candidatus Krumholzibacteria bacterium]|nr:carotenoid 1,2-hydratase [Candidatus Krumholzibacteria bacterium]
MIASVVLLAAFVVLVKTTSQKREPQLDRLRVSELLARTDTTGFARATALRTFVFPTDHGPHNDYKTEWWYYTGNLVSASGERFGFQLTFFRSALDARYTTTASGWRTNHIFMAHFAVTDVARAKFHAFERFGRAANGLAGAHSRPFRVWLDDWCARADTTSWQDASPVMHLRAGEGNITLDLQATSKKPVVLQGEKGLSHKGEGEGNASYYYSLTQMDAVGRIGLSEREVEVTGTVWMDREWSTSALEKDQTGWDWFALQLSDSTELMYYRIRRTDGRPDPHSRGSLVDRRGEKTDVMPADIIVETRDWWQSPRGGRYPARWRVVIDKEKLDVVVEPLVADQELDLSFRYWEGAVEVSGTRDGKPLEGVGYVELTGYAE